MSTIKLDTREMDRIIKDTGRNGAQILNRLAFEVQGEAQMHAPVDTGAHRNSAFVDPATAQDPVATVGFTMEYSPFLELGTSKMAARPHLVPAVESMARKFNSGETWRELVK